MYESGDLKYSLYDDAEGATSIYATKHGAGDEDSSRERQREIKRVPRHYATLDMPTKTHHERTADGLSGSSRVKSMGGESRRSRAPMGRAPRPCPYLS